MENIKANTNKTDIGMHTSMNLLHRLANLYGIRTSYLDMDSQIKTASIESLLAVLKSMGAPLHNLTDVPSAIREKILSNWQQMIEPVIVFRENDDLTLNVRLPVRLVGHRLKGILEMETGERREFSWLTDPNSTNDSINIEGTVYGSLRLSVPEKLPPGYHKLRLELADQICDSLIIIAPLIAYSPSTLKKIWGIFLPLYALHSSKSWGAGNYSDMEALLDWASKTGGRILGTVPLLASFMDPQFGPGPYTPASRLFWNDFYLDIEKIPELRENSEALSILNSEDFQNELGKLRSAKQVNYFRQSLLQRKVLEKLVESFFSRKSSRFQEYSHYLDSNLHLEDYACFRACGELNGINWNEWPESMRNGKLVPGNYLESSRRLHLYAQWITHTQIQSLSQKSMSEKSFLYLDLPVGVHPFSYDVWKKKNIFVRDASGGAPPDPVFTSGQNWKFPPLHPEKIRRECYRYVIESLRHQLSCANMLRIDHIMNFHRLFWIPEGLPNNEGVYVNYHAEELYAILALESRRHQSVIVGEDLGMVPPEVRPMMEKHGIYRMFVGQYELIAENQLGQIPSHSVASMNTHDMFPFTAFWQESDILERQKLKLLNVKNSYKEIDERREIKRKLISILKYRGMSNEISQDTEAMLQAILNLLAASPAYAVLINLEDLWLENIPQNIPGTNRKQNWCHKARYSLEHINRSLSLEGFLQQINRLREKAGNYDN